jgi:pipecolate-incorporating enzyme
VPPGAIGELCLAGEGLARGYLGQPEETARRFVGNPFDDEPGARMYRTGDLVRQDRSGLLTFFGRADRQVKLRGFRIELDEIETVLRRAPQVREAVVLMRSDLPGGDTLVAYWTGDASEARLRDHLLAALPAYMVPTHMIRMDHLPLLRNGKLDRGTMPLPDIRAAIEADPAEHSPSRPTTPEEQLLVEVFRDTLGLADIGVDDSFLERGGHSLLAVRVVSRLFELTDVRLPLRLIFALPTARALAPELAARRSGAPPQKEAVGPGEVRAKEPSGTSLWKLLLGWLTGRGSARTAAKSADDETGT